MDANSLRALQALKARYAAHPSDARITLRATGSVEDRTSAARWKPGAPWPSRAFILQRVEPGLNCARATCCSRRLSPAPA